MTTNTTSTNLAPPPQWPPAVVSQFDPVRLLGKGGFASVLLAKKKDDGALAAIKVVGSGDDKDKEVAKQDYGYAHREIDILKELSHSGIMQVLEYWEPKGAYSCIVMALSYSPGPTLEHLLKLGGAVSLTFGRVVMAQVMDALAYCHSRAVIHRDIKPDNVIVTGASASQNEIWVDSEDDKADKSWGEWKELCKKWKVTLIDFGFARALTPEDVEKERVAVRTLSAHNMNPITDSPATSRHSRRSGGAGQLDKSVSHALTRTMSALGNRWYAAPEVTSGVHSRHLTEQSSELSKSGHYRADITKTLSHHVANYGMLADAFSLGNTLQYMMTGVPPNQGGVNEVINMYNSPISIFFRFLADHVCSSANDGGRKYQYRGWSKMPKDIKELIRGLNHPSVAQRVSVRASRRYPIIESILDDPNAEPVEEAAHHRVDFLPCTRKKSSAEHIAENRLERVPGAPVKDDTEKTDSMSPNSSHHAIGLEL